jgi:hypothetical protein
MTSLQQLFDRVVDLVEEIPLGNSITQTRMAVVNEQRTPQRAIRSAALQVLSRLQALNEAYYNSKKNEIEIDMFKAELAVLKNQSEPITSPRYRLIELELERRQATTGYGKKLVKDALTEIAVLLPILEKAGKIKRADFEAEEIEHYRVKYPEIVFTADEGDLFTSLGGIAAVDESELYLQLTKKLGQICQ